MAKIRRGRAPIRSQKSKDTRRPNAMSMDRKTTRTHYEARDIVSDTTGRKQALNDNRNIPNLRPVRAAKARVRKVGNPLEGVVFNAQWTIGTNGSRYGYSSSNYGGLVPDFVQGTEVDTFRTSSGDIVKVDLELGVQIPTLGAGSVDMYFEGYPNNPVLFSWDPAESFYASAPDLVLEQWVIDNLGNTVGVEGIPVNAGSELIVNGTFDTNLDGWSDSGGDVTWNAGGYAQRLAVTTGNFTQNNIPNLVQGKTYRVSVTTADVVGVSTIMLGHTVVQGTTLPEGSGTWTGNIVCGFEDFDFSIRTVSGTFGKVDNMSVREI